MFSQLFSLSALALLAVQGSSKTLQSVFDVPVLEGNRCGAQHATMHVPDDDIEEEDSSVYPRYEGRLYHQNGQIKVSYNKVPTVWTLERECLYDDAWRIYWIHPNGNKQYWYASDQGFGVSGSKSATLFNIKYAEDGKTGERRFVFHWNEYCLNYGPEDDVWMSSDSLCETIILKNATLPEWKSLHRNLEGLTR